MSVVFKKLTDEKEIATYVEVHKEIFGLSELETYPASFFSILIRKEQPSGLVIGCYIDGELKGMAVGMAGSKYKSLYITFAGILKDHQGGRTAYNLFKNLQENAIQEGYRTVFGVIDPLQSNVGKLHTNLGSVFYKTVSDRTGQETVVKLMFEFDAERYTDRNKESVPDWQNTTAYIDDIGMKDKELLYEIPNNFKELRCINPAEAKKYRDKANRVLYHYIDEQGYIITKCFSKRLNGKKKTYYLFEKS